MRMIHALLLLATLVLGGCASNPMQVAPDQKLAAPTSQTAQVVFMRSSFVGSAINASVYDVTNDELVFIGIMANGTKLSHQVPPGKRRFMVVSEAADFMEADLAPGLTYYGMVTPRMGAWKARFSLWPIKKEAPAEFHQGMADFKTWREGTQLVGMTPAAQQWFAANRADIEAKRKEYLVVWQRKSPKELQERTLSRTDGRRD